MLWDPQCGHGMRSAAPGLCNPHLESRWRQGAAPPFRPVTMISDIQQQSDGLTYRSP